MVDDGFGEQLQAAGRMLERARMHARLSKVHLADLAQIHPRTLRRMETGAPADLASYAAVGSVLGLPPDWFLRAAELVEPASDAARAVRSAERSVETAAATGWYGPEGIALLRDIHGFARDHR